tara:strand:- start:192 stop:656 length:465 start_codon:yes stop_codon:yes gene_type:complete
MKKTKKIKGSLQKRGRHIYHGIIQSEKDIRFFINDKQYQKRQLSILKKDLRQNAKKINEEVQLEKDAILLLKKHSKGAKLTKAEKKIVKTSLIDICKVVPSLGIFLLPGGMILLPLVSKILPFDLMPSAFQDRKKRPKRTKRSKKKLNEDKYFN